MELGLDFDDEDFESKRQTGLESQKSYSVKICTDFWYNFEKPEPDNAGVIYKFRGDNLYHQKSYIEAIDCYKDGLDSLPLNNKALRQDILECMARCYLHIDKHAEALEIAHKLMSDAKSFDQVMQTRLLLSQIQERNNDFLGQEENLKHLLMMHPFTYSLWIKLGHCYQIMMEDNNTETLKLRRLSCLVRVRLLLRNILRNSDSFFKVKLLKLLQETEEQLIQLEVPDHISLAVKFLREDMEESLDEDDNNERDEHKESYVNIEVTESEVDSFEQRWFSWIANIQLT